MHGQVFWQVQSREPKTGQQKVQLYYKDGNQLFQSHETGKTVSSHPKKVVRRSRDSCKTAERLLRLLLSFDGDSDRVRHRGRRNDQPAGEQQQRQSSG